MNTSEWRRSHYDKMRAELGELVGRKCLRCGFADQRALSYRYRYPPSQRELLRTTASNRAARLVKSARRNPMCVVCNCLNCLAILNLLD